MLNLFWSQEYKEDLYELMSECLVKLSSGRKLGAEYAATYEA